MFSVDYLQNSMVGWCIKRKNFRGAWMAHSVQYPTLDLNLGLNLRVVSSRPTLGSTLGMVPRFKKNLEQRSKQNLVTW